MLLAGKTVVITGAATGIGKAIAQRLAREGAWVAITDLNKAGAEEVAEALRQEGAQAVGLRLDVTNPEEIAAAIRRVLELRPRLDIWINNAGVSTMNRFIELSEQEWDFNMNVNAKGTFLCSQQAARQMISQQPDSEGLRGKIINIASMAGKRGNAPFLAHYVASKFAVIGLTQAMAGELAPFSILVNAVCPGYVRTSMQEREAGWEAKLRNLSTDEVLQLYISDTPLRRLETPEDVAGVVFFLASSDANFITGEAINVNGGAWMD
uniref:Short-chain dehydrogenase/reductase n=1 Tax=uncultured Chloroflexota bacterium TaxID=166587 RepID=H5SID4_9CHLR|nr:short-chain dehydrogenase/reductase [uncultured Chloroflexota bacterium]